MNWNLQSGKHPDADRLSIFVEGAATAREQEKMLAHLAECAECRKAVFLMQPHEEPQRVPARPEKGWMWRWLVPVGLPAAALACGLIAVLVYIRPHGAPQTPQRMASMRPPSSERPETRVASSGNLKQGAPTGNADRASINSEQVAGSGRPKNSFAPNAAATSRSRQNRPIASDLSLPKLKKDQATAGATPQTAGAGPSASVQTADSAVAQSTISSATISALPFNGRNVTDLQQRQPGGAKGAASQKISAGEQEQPALQIQGASAQNETLAGVSGRVTDRSGAVIAGVTVTLRDAAGKTRQTTTSADGGFHLTQLPAGQYELTATVAGFKTSKQSIELKPSELALLEPVLDIGTASEVVEVDAVSGAASVETESANVSGQAVREMNGVGRVTAVPSGLPVAETVSHGKRFLSLDDAGNLFLSRNEGKKWKKIKPQWTGKAVRIELAPAYSEAQPKARNETSATPSEGAVFQLTNDAGGVWASKDGAHWHQ